MVPAPSFFTLASQDVRMLSSRSVAVIVSRLPLASTKRFERMGIVVLRSTTPWVSSSSSSRSDLFTLNSISGSPYVCCADFGCGYCTAFLYLYKYIRKPPPSPHLWILRKTYQVESCAPLAPFV